jgi:hypothetical protein
MPISNSKETIDERVLRLLGLEDVFDLDYDTYLILLKEAMVKGRMTKKTIPTEEIMLLTDEYKRVRSKKNSGRFEVKKKKISAGSFSVGSVKGKLTGAKATKALTASKSLGQSPLSKSLEDNISAITAAVVSISETLKAQKKLSDSASEYGRRKGEKDKRALAETNLEKRFGGLKKAAEKIIAPVKSLLDRLLNFLTTIILGRIVFKLVDWLADPNNASKVKSIIRFLGDWWPALLGAYVLFGTTFGKFVRGTVGMLGRFIFQIGKVAIPQLLKFIKSPLGIGAALFTAGATVPMLFPGTVNEQERKTQKAPGTTEDKIKALQQQKANLNFFDKLQGKGSEIDEQISLLKTGKTKSYGFSGGAFTGLITGPGGPKGDKIPAMLSDGEFVVSAGAVQKYGVDTFEAMNAAGGGTNRPTIISGISHAAGGGLIGDIGREAYNYSRNFGSNSEYLVGEVLKGLSSEYKWANDLARKAGISVQGAIKQSTSNLYNQGVRAQNYLRNGLQKDASRLMQSGTQFGAGLYDQALKVGNQALADVQSGKLQNQVMQAGNNIAQTPKNAAGGFFDFMKNMSSSKGYQENSAKIGKMQDKMITLGDNFIKKLPDGPFKEIADKGLIPIPSGNPTMMRNLTFVKAMLGPLGKPFKILSNKQVDEMRRKTIEKTMSKSGLITDPKTGEVRMNWNQEDINKGARGGGAYTDDLGPGGSAFNSTLGRFTASTEGGGNTLYTDDRYNFNKTVAEYAQMAKQGLMKGSISDATYFGASMLGRFAQDIGWLNQRALGSRIKIGDIDRSRLDMKTGKNKPPTPQIAKSKPKTLPVKPPVKTTTVMQGQTGVTMYSKNDPRRKNNKSSQSTPRFSASSRNKNSRAKMSILGITI